MELPQTMFYRRCRERLMKLSIIMMLTQPIWDMMTFKGDRPTPEEFIYQVAMMLDQGNSIAQ